MKSTSSHPPSILSSPYSPMQSPKHDFKERSITHQASRTTNETKPRQQPQQPSSTSPPRGFRFRSPPAAHFLSPNQVTPLPSFSTQYEYHCRFLSMTLTSNKLIPILLLIFFGFSLSVHFRHPYPYPSPLLPSSIRFTYFPGVPQPF